jgi:hypothetical protein
MLVGAAGIVLTLGGLPIVGVPLICLGVIMTMFSGVCVFLSIGTGCNPLQLPMLLAGLAVLVLG